MAAWTGRPAERARTGDAGFTLAELLTVMAIIALLTGLLVLGVRGFNGSTNRRSAVGTLMGVFDQARSLAISDGRATYVVFVSTHGQDQSGSGVPARMWGQAFALFEDPILQDSMTSFVPQQRSNWLYLPTSVAFKCTGSTGGTPDSLTACSPAGSDTTKFNVPATGGAASLQLPYLKFDPAGQIVDSTNQVLAPGAAQLRILLFEGTASNTGAEVVTRRGSGATGTNVNKYALDEIMLKPVTGRAHYTLDPSYNLAVTN